jgi:hypothetical protein
MTPESIWGLFVVIPDILITLLINPLDAVWGSIGGDCHDLFMIYPWIIIAI